MLQFPDDSIGQLTWLFEFNCLLSTRDSYKRRYKPAGIIGPIILTVIFIGAFNFLLDDSEPAEERTLAAVYSISALHMCIKALNFFLKRHQLSRLFKLTRKLWGLHLKEFSEEIRLEAEAKAKKMTKFIFLSLQIIMPLMMVKALLLNMGAKTKEDYRLPFPFIFILDKRDYFFTYCGFEAIMLAVALHLSALIFSFLYLMTTQVTAHMRVLCVTLQAGKSNFKAAISHHVNVIRIVEEFNSVMGGPLMFESICYALQIATFGFNTIKILNTKENMGQLPLNMYMMLTYLLMPYLLCSWGEEITSQSQVIFSSTYLNEWYQLDVKNQKKLLMIMMLARKNLVFSYRGLMTYNMETFAQIIHCTYSYLTLLSGMNL